MGRNKKQIQEYIRNQLKEDYMADQLTLFEEVNPFTGQKNRKKLRNSLELVSGCGAEGKTIQWAF